MHKQYSRAPNKRKRGEGGYGREVDPKMHSPLPLHIKVSNRYLTVIKVFIFEYTHFWIYTSLSVENCPFECYFYNYPAPTSCLLILQKFLTLPPPDPSTHPISTAEVLFSGALEFVQLFAYKRAIFCLQIKISKILHIILEIPLISVFKPKIGHNGQPTDEKSW